MLNLGFTEILIVIVVAIVVVGPERLPTVVRWLGRQYGKLMRASDELRRAFTMEAERVEAEERAKVLRKRREEARARVEAARQAALDTPIPRPIGTPAPSAEAAPHPPAPSTESSIPAGPATDHEEDEDTLTAEGT